MFKMQTLNFRELIFKFYFQVPLDKYLNRILLLTSKNIFIFGKNFILKNFIKKHMQF
jgi:hypothetical protein